MPRKNKSVYGVGTLDIDQQVTRSVKIGDKYRIVWRCPYFSRWSNMLKRCYNKKAVDVNKTYSECFVCEEWHLFSNFKAWMIEQDWQGKHLDKDILVSGNKEYNPQSCTFIDQETNKLLEDSAKIRGAYPLGVCKQSNINKFSAKISAYGIVKYLGTFFTPQEAHRAWQKEKHKIIYEVATKITDDRVKKALFSRCEHLLEDMNNNVETIKL